MKFVKVNAEDYVNPRNIDCVCYMENLEKWVCLMPSGLFVIDDIERFGKELGTEFVYEKKEECKCCDECKDCSDEKKTDEPNWWKEYREKMNEFSKKMEEFNKMFNSYGKDSDTDTDED